MMGVKTGDGRAQMAQQVKMLSMKSEDLSSIPGYHMVAGGNQLPQIVP